MKNSRERKKNAKKKSFFQVLMSKDNIFGGKKNHG